jgi:hypothetical protein
MYWYLRADNHSAGKPPSLLLKHPRMFDVCFW